MGVGLWPPSLPGSRKFWSPGAHPSTAPSPSINSGPKRVRPIPPPSPFPARGLGPQGAELGAGLGDEGSA